MVRGFACPECGAEVAPKGLSPGRQVRCPDCSTWVEVPFIPRQGGTSRRSKRLRRKDQVLIGLGWTLGVLVALAALVLGIRNWHRTQVRHASEEQAALRRRVEDQLKALEAEPSEPDLDTALGLLARVGGDPSLSSLKGRARQQFDRARDRWAAAELAAADAALADGRRAEVLALGEGMARRIATFPPGSGDHVAGEIRDRIGAVARQIGAVVEPARGRFLFGSPSAYDKDLRRLAEAALRRRGYLVPAASSPVRALWDEQAAYRMAVTIAERQAARYLDTPHRTCEIEAHLSLGHRGSPTWSDRLTARTRVPLSMLSPAEIRRLNLGTRADSAIERRLYEDALAFLLGQIELRLRNVPSPAVAPGGVR
ncbi:MAG TPA: hypothetical protein VF590_25615 [Isosphaeraceae bacterium]